MARFIELNQYNWYGHEKGNGESFGTHKLLINIDDISCITSNGNDGSSIDLISSNDCIIRVSNIYEDVRHMISVGQGGIPMSGNY